MIGFGLDLSGYSTRGTTLAAVQISGDTADAVILQGSAFSRYRHGVDDASKALREEREALSWCLACGPVAVDVPIDLQGLPAPDGGKFIWELTKRPVDHAFEALAPLADRLGACAARFKAVIATDELRLELGRRMFETYPAGSLRLMGKRYKGYKGNAGRDLCNTIARELGCPPCNLSDHELDAIICAVTAVAPDGYRLEGKRLVQRMHKIDPFTEMTPLGGRAPTGFVLLERWPVRRLTVAREDFEPWIKKARCQQTQMVSQDPRITPELVAEHGLKPDEYDRILKLIGRAPSVTELGIFSAMWNEHCSYKSSKVHLRGLPTTGRCVIQGPGENAGVIDIGGGLACVFKMESHNHPSYIEPYQGAATGVGGILRDVFTMGARPIACLNALSFGDPNHPKTRHLVSGVVAGIGGYGNSFGVPTVGGSVRFHSRYDGNILVNAMAVGLAEADKIFYAAASGVGMPIVYLGSKTGRDGIHGATMASAEFGENSEEKRPTVQVGDPFAEKLLLEACLEIMAKGCVIAIQDMGAAGLTCSAVEMGAKGDLGVTLDLDKVPCRETGMTAYEMMLSESQERMLMVLKPEKETEAEAVFRKWGLDFAVVGETTPTRRFVVRHGGAVMADLPIKELGDEAPVYRRPFVEPRKLPVVDAAAVVPPMPIADALERLIESPDLCSKRWVWEQYDHVILGNTVQRPGGDAAVVRVNDGPTALALTTDVTPRYCEADPLEGGKQAVAEAWRNLTSVGATPLAITDNLNFGNPERPEVMGQFVGCVRGISEACKALDFPVVSGNVSLYNETNGKAILPTPSIGGVGLLADFTGSATLAFKAAGEAILLVGLSQGWLGQSLYLRDICGREEGAPPPVDLASEKRNGDFVRALIERKIATGVHDVSDGGLAVAVAEMAMAAGVGADLRAAAGTWPVGQMDAAFWFGEDQARYVVTVREDAAADVLDRAATAGVPVRRIGTTGGATLTLPAQRPILVATLHERFENWLPDYMSGGGGRAQ